MCHAFARLCLFATFVGATLPAVAANPAAGAPVADLCAPCTSGDQCIGTACVLQANGAGLCSQTCTTDADCPPAFGCNVANQSCVPVTAASCPTAYLAPVNVICQFPGEQGTTPGPARNCAAGLICYLKFATDSSATQPLGECVEACSTATGGPTCPLYTSCCFDTQSDGSCAPSSSSASFGGCFNVGDVGDSCSEPNTFYCVTGAACAFAVTQSAAYCYDRCDAGICYEGGVCSTVLGSALCCDSATYVAGNAQSCRPAPSYCRRQAGVTCSENAQCRSGLCYKSNNQGVCTMPCLSGADCPDAAADVNLDGAADGGQSCKDFGAAKYCWPIVGAAAPPACASAKLDLTPLTRGSGCHCQTGAEGAAAEGLTVLGLMACCWRRRRRNQA